MKLADLENVINILEYRAIPLEKCKIVVQSIKIPTGKGRLYLTKDTVSRKKSIVTVKGLHIIYWGYGAGNIAYGATTFCEGKHMGQQPFFKTYIQGKDFFDRN